MDIQYRLAGKRDIPAILSIIRQAQASIARLGIAQWQDGYPNREIFEQDIQREQCYIFLIEKRIAGVMVVSFESEECYRALTGGKWLSELPYGVVHRMAVADAARSGGLAGQMMELAEICCLQNGVTSLRVDTHEGNLPMRKFLKKHGFTLCGTVDYGGPDGKRIALEKLL